MKKSLTPNKLWIVDNMKYNLFSLVNDRFNSPMEDYLEDPNTNTYPRGKSGTRSISNLIKQILLNDFFLSLSAGQSYIDNCSSNWETNSSKFKSDVDHCTDDANTFALRFIYFAYIQFIEFIMLNP